MPVKIHAIGGTSGFFRAGDEILSIDGRPVEDQLDVLFLPAGEESAEYAVRRVDGRTARRRLRAETVAAADLRLEELRFRSCRSRCVFCFVDQMPGGLRQSLYAKDDDYRLSFLFGNYVTLADVSGEDIDRIVEYGLSPVYVSVHALDRDVRERLSGRPMRSDILRTMRRLARGGVTMHAQIVLVPGYNDGEVLERTVEGLFSLWPNVASTSIVPVGLTRHRRGLARLARPGAAMSGELVRVAESMRGRFAERTGGDPFLYLADEILLAANRRIPPAEWYGDFPQLSNGVGMARVFIDETARRAARLSRWRGNARLLLVTGKLGGRLFRRHIEPILAPLGPRIDVAPRVVTNRLFGSCVTVSGLLAGADIAAAAREADADRCLVLPPNVLNHEGRLLDESTPASLARELGRRVIAARQHFLEPGVIGRCGPRKGSR